MNWTTEKINQLNKLTLSGLNSTVIERDMKISHITDTNPEFPGKFPFYRNDYNLRASNVPFEYTEEELDTMELTNDPKFLSKIINFPLRDYQEETVDNYLKHRFNLIVNSRQTGMSSVKALIVMSYVMNNYDKTVLIVSNIGQTTKEFMNKIKKFYYSLPFYIKPGVKKWNSTSAEFDNGCRITTKFAIPIGYSIDFLVMDEFAHMDQKILTKFWSNIYPIMTARSDSKILIGSTPNGNNLFKHLIYNHNGFFNNQFIHYSKVSGRDESWKKSTIEAIGSIELFAQEYELLFQGTKEWRRYVNIEKLTN